MANANAESLREIKTFRQFVKFARDELGWEHLEEEDDFDEYTFEYEADELGIDPNTAANVKKIYQLRPVVNQPFGIFFVEFDSKALPVAALRRILNTLVKKQRANASKSKQATWALEDLLFVANTGLEKQRKISLAHFSSSDNNQLPSLKIVDWDESTTTLKLDHVYSELQEKLAWPDDETDIDGWRRQWASAFQLRPKQCASRLDSHCKECLCHSAHRRCAVNHNGPYAD